ncbi:LOW QUALITY PROTEIN: CCR4-NOT transcription complex subunit 3-like [Amphiura filiformis]|uniref:LOW QUALITY PROTEIN: CCR4-NOT transcription complex subunit 3-like n=1 Tax=Amphiura filiformis TaxID=82378 RepID=UPI003B22298A
MFEESYRRVETFEDIWQKVHNATNSNQKEKYEADLKKEIKKLQRLRDQIKTWAASNEIKDKRTLLENRKLIETQMERFKVVERETKTKAYSKEGLGLATKVDPIQKEKDDMCGWLATNIDKLNLMVDQFECEIESINSSTKKKKLASDKQERIEELNTYLEKHRFHIKNLETLMRMLDNSTVEVDQLKRIQDDVEYYIECCQEPDFEESEFLHDDLDIDDSEFNANVIATSPDDDAMTNTSGDTPRSGSPSPSSSNNHSKEKNDTSDETKRTKSASESESVSSPRKISGGKGSTSSVTSPMATSAPSSNRPTVVRVASSPGSATIITPTTPTTPTPQLSISNSTSNKNSLSKTNSLPPVTQHTIAQPPQGPAYAVAAGAQHNNTSQVTTGPQQILGNVNAQQQPLVVAVHPASQHQTQPQVRVQLNNTQQPRPDMNGPHQAFNMSALENSLDHIPTTSFSSNGLSLTNNVNQVTLSSVPVSSSSVLNNATPVSLQQQLPSSAGGEPAGVQVSSSQPSSIVGTTKPTEVVMNGPLSPSMKQNDSDSMSSLKKMAQKAVMSAGLENIQSTPDFTAAGDRAIYDSTQRESQQASTGAPQLQETSIPPLLGVAPLGPAAYNKDQVYQQTMIEAAYHHLPHPSDSERLRNYLPRNPCPTPSYHCQVMPAHMDSAEFFQRLSTETLFFIFYYQEGTKAQYLAAKALKRQSWRFHTKYMMWFQRHEEPKTITDEYEQGTYIYFDYEKWKKKKKEGFTFEYRYLEDKEL